jgi:hypothetical protein
MTWSDTTFTAMKVLRQGPLVLRVTADWRQDKALESEEDGPTLSGLSEFVIEETSWTCRLLRILYLEGRIITKLRWRLVRGGGGGGGWMRNVQWNVESGYQFSTYRRTERNYGKQLKTSIDSASRRISLMHTDCQPAIRYLNTRSLKAVRMFAVPSI